MLAPNGRFYSGDGDNYAPSSTQAPTPNPKVVSAFSIGLGQRSIEV